MSVPETDSQKEAWYNDAILYGLGERLAEKYVTWAEENSASPSVNLDVSKFLEEESDSWD
tara:strand:+ start:473 stop:652 length:180 start_codon:yes stop_codon:yes gene_type:complete